MYLLHPIFVHFSIALLSLASLSLLYARCFSKPACALQFADSFLFFGLFLTIFTVFFGFVSWYQLGLTLPAHSAVLNTLNDHRDTALASFTVYLITGLWRAQQLLLKRPLSWWIVGFGVIGLMLLCIAGWYGGQLVYHYHLQ